MLQWLHQARPELHMLLHFAVPLVLALIFYRPRLGFAWLVMMATMLVDIDHLLADPLYDPDRCSIGFHPLHRYAVLPLYLVLALWPRTRLVGLGLVIHMVLDGLDCLWMRCQSI